MYTPESEVTVFEASQELGLSYITIDNDSQQVVPNHTLDFGIREIAALCHSEAYEKGWWTDLTTGQPKAINVPQCLMLIVSELSEALEGDRKNLMDDKLPHRKMIEVELADALIRLFDTAGALKLDVVGAVIEKMKYNRNRADHKIENRKLANGKAY